MASPWDALAFLRVRCNNLQNYRDHPNRLRGSQCEASKRPIAHTNPVSVSSVTVFLRPESLELETGTVP